MQCSYSHDIVPDESLPYIYTPIKCYFSTTLLYTLVYWFDPRVLHNCMGLDCSIYRLRRNCMNFAVFRMLHEHYPKLFRSGQVHVVDGQ